MTDDRDKPEGPPDPFPIHRDDSPFPPLGLELGAPADPPSDWMETADAHDLPTRDNALVALGRFAFPPAPPLDDEGLAARDRRWTGVTIMTAAVFLLVFNAVSPLNWSRQQAPGWVPDTVRQLSEVWVEQLSVFGVDQPRQGLRELWQGAREARWIGQRPAADAGSTSPPES